MKVNGCEKMFFEDQIKDILYSHWHRWNSCSQWECRSVTVFWRRDETAKQISDFTPEPSFAHNDSATTNQRQDLGWHIPGEQSEHEDKKEVVGK